MEGFRKGRRLQWMRGGISYTWNWVLPCLPRTILNGEIIIMAQYFFRKDAIFSFLPVKNETCQMAGLYIYNRLLISLIDDSRSTGTKGSWLLFQHNLLSACMGVTLERLNLSVGNAISPVQKINASALLSPLLFYTFLSSSGTALRNLLWAELTIFHQPHTGSLAFALFMLRYLLTTLGLQNSPTGKSYNCLSWKTGFRVSNMFNSTPVGYSWIYTEQARDLFLLFLH